MGRDSVEPTNKTRRTRRDRTIIAEMSQIADVWHHSGRRNPATGVLISRDRPTIVFLTVCTLHREATLAQQIYHDAVVQAWTQANAWFVGAYVIMPDHVHLFCAPRNEEIAIERWIVFWKRQFRRKVGPAAPRFQSRGFHHRLRRDENYHQKWECVRANPVRARLVRNAEEWPYQGVLNHLPWYGDAHPSGSSARLSLAPPARTSKRFVGSTESRPTSVEVGVGE